jgi:hypothetical protein
VDLAMKMIQVSSSAITAIGYDPQSRRMTLVFTQSRTYDFCGVPQNVFDGLLRASSKGGYYNDYIKDRYPC